MMLNKLDLVTQYYVDEWPIERITKEAGCTSQTVRNRRTAYEMPDRDRGWTPEDDLRAAHAMGRLTMGASLIGDMRTMASELMHRTSTILKHCGGIWLARYAPHVDTVPPGLGGFPIKRPTLRIKKLHPDAQVPKRQSEEAAGYDLHSIEDLTIPAGNQAMIETGLAIAVPVGWVGLISPRSGMAAKSGIGIQNAPGILDSDYRGEVKVILHNTGTMQTSYKVEIGDRIGQLVIVPCYLGDAVEVADLDETERGVGGFGSTLK